MKAEKISLLQGLLSPEELNTILSETKDTVDDNLLFEYLLNNNLLFLIDLSEKYQESRLIDFIIERAYQFNMDFIKDINTLDKKVKNINRKKNLTPLELNLYILKKIKKSLQKDFTIGQLKKEGNNIYICLLKKKNFKKIRNHHYPFGDFEKIEFDLKED